MDPELIGFATEIRKRAERRAGELLGEMLERGEREGLGRPASDEGGTPMAVAGR
jgi:hypothetical protein